MIINQAGSEIIIPYPHSSLDCQIYGIYQGNATVTWPDSSPLKVTCDTL